MDKLEDRHFLLQGAMWQDSLLQAYRSLHVTFQSILLAIGIGLVVATMSSVSSSKLPVQPIVSTGLLFCLWLLQRVTSKNLQGIVLNRGDDLNYWHTALILCEQQLPSRHRHFTNFKIHQQARRENVAHLEQLFLSDKPIERDQTDLLIEKGLGHTRHVVDQQLFAQISLIWIALVLVSCLFTAGSIITMVGTK